MPLPLNLSLPPVKWNNEDLRNLDDTPKPAGPPNAMWERDWKNPDAHAHHHCPRSLQTPILTPYPDSPPRRLLPCRPVPSATSMNASPWTPPILPLHHKHKVHAPNSCWKAQQSGGACTALRSR